MPNYSVGNLEIVFKSLDNEVGASLKKTAQGLRALAKSLTLFTDDGITKIKAFSSAMRPFLRDIIKANDGLVALNQTVRQLGVNRVSQLAKEVERLRQASSGGAGGATGTPPTPTSGNMPLATRQVYEFAQAEEKVTDEIKDQAEVWRYMERYTNRSYAAMQQADNEHIEYLKNAIKYQKVWAVNEQGNVQVLELSEQQLKGYKQELEELEKQQAKVNKKTGSFGKLWTSIKRVTIYRLIRAGLKAIVNTFRSTIQEYALLDDNVNNSMSRITTGLERIKLAIGSSILPLLEAVAPIVEEIGINFAEAANAISELNAQMRGETEYTKINTKALKDYRTTIQSINKFSFDKFETLSGGKKDSLLEKAGIGTNGSGGGGGFDKSNKELTETKNNYKEIYNTIKLIGDVIAFVTELISRRVYWISLSLNLLKPIIGVIAVVLEFVTKISESTMAISIDFFKMFTGNFSYSNTKGLGKTWTNWASLRFFANGGLPDAGTMFWAGEAGAEVVYNQPSGQAGVATIEQIGQAVANGLIRSGAVKYLSLIASKDYNTYIDSKVIARSPYFQAEAKRISLGSRI